MNTDTNTTPDTQTEKNRKFARIVAIALAVIVVIAFQVFEDARIGH